MSTPEPNPDKVISRANPIVLTRKAIACGQLESAIYLWFHDKDVVSVHTLACAALEVIHGVGDKQGKPTVIGQNVKKLSKTKQKKFKMAQNFFKHASRDPNVGLSFPPETSEFVMFDALRSYLHVFHELTPLMAAFSARFSISWHEVLGSVVTAEGMFMVAIHLKKEFPIDEFIGLSRQQFLKQALRLFA